MTSKDFRIGNFVKARTTDDKFNVVKEIGFSDNQRGYYLRLENVNHGVWLEYNGENFILGIPITEEWLVNLGFDLVVKVGNQGEFKVYQLNEITYNTNHGWWWKHHLTVQPKYVNELQNLFFALTGRELELK